MKSKSIGCQITTVEITDDKITGRGGLLNIIGGGLELNLASKNCC